MTEGRQISGDTVGWGCREEKITKNKRDSESKIAEFVNINAANISNPFLKLYFR
jgi:hypothetical protein